VQTLPGGLSGLVAQVLLRVFGGRHSLTEPGIRLPLEGNMFLLRAELGGWIADEKALKEVFGIKGSSGSKPCFRCKNLLTLRGEGRAANDQGYSCGLSEPSLQAFDQHTNDSVWQMVDLLLQRKGCTGVGEFKRLEQVLGVVHDPQALLLCPQMRRILKPSSGFWFDWMHVLVSGGVCCDELKYLLSACVERGITLQQIDAFISAIQLPGRQGRVHEHLLERRFNTPGEDGKLRLFAGEMLVLMPLVRHFCRAVLEPAAVLREQRRSFYLLCDILELLNSKDNVLAHIGRLQSLIEEHHQVFAELYGDHVKPKLHYVLHVPQNMVEMRANLSCFVVERKHRACKAFAAAAFRHYEKVVTHALLNQHVHDLGAPCALSPSYSQSPREVGGCQSLFAPFATGVRVVLASKRATLERTGGAVANDIVTLAGEHEEEEGEVGMVQIFFETVADNGERRLFVQVLRYARLAQWRYDRRLAAERLYDATRIVAAEAHYSGTDGTLCLLPRGLI